jgi:S-adenosylmethionine:tRNA ribosyltransferase-isomerase
VRASEFDFHLPPEQIAQFPTARRDQSRLLHLDRHTGKNSFHQFPEIKNLLKPGDVLVLNNSKVIPARLRAINETTQGHFEILLTEENAPNDWWALMKPGKRARPGTRLALLGPDEKPAGISATVTSLNEEGHRRLQFSVAEGSQKKDGANLFSCSSNILDWLDSIGEMPLPPYIQRDSPAALKRDLERYQTVFALEKGSVAAPTAGLHFTPELLEALKHQGIRVHHITLHVGLGTFTPVKVEELGSHIMHEERFSIPEATARAVNEAKIEHRRIVAVGTTSTRVLESVAADHHGELVPGEGRTRIFIYPPYKFRVVDALLTNFHLPRSTLLMLVSAFAAPAETRGRDLILSAYDAAIQKGFRFFSYGDAMLIT